MLMSSWNDGWRKTNHPGIFASKGAYRVRVRVTDPRTRTRKEVNRVYENITLQDAVSKQVALRDELEASSETRRLRVGEFARLWSESKAALVDRATADRYANALDDHVLPALGRYYYDELRPVDVQQWVNAELREGYAVASVHGWFRVLRTMTRDAVAQLDLPRDPTGRISFPDPKERDEANALTPGELSQFLDVMRREYPRNYALTVTLAFTGLRFCHASALKWDDIDEGRGVIRVQRKNVRGHVGPVSRRKRAPRELPLGPELASILREHRRALVERQAPGLDDGWCFPGLTGALRTPGSLWKAWQGCMASIGMADQRFTVHGLRRTFNDLARRAGVDGIITRSITGHVTEKMTAHYSTVALDEKRTAMTNVVRLVPMGDRLGDRAGEKKKAG